MSFGKCRIKTYSIVLALLIVNCQSILELMLILNQTCYFVWFRISMAAFVKKRPAREQRGVPFKTSGH